MASRPHRALRRTAPWAVLAGLLAVAALTDWRGRTPEPAAAPTADAPPESYSPGGRPERSPARRKAAATSREPAAPLPEVLAGMSAAASFSAECRRAGGYGRCDGDVATACVGGRVVRADCAARGFRCAMTSEGASCLPRTGELDCDGKEQPTCDGDHLRICQDGTWQEVDCGLRLSRCEAGAAGAKCKPDSAAATRFALPEPQPCDDESACERVELIAFVPEHAQLRDLDTRMQAELAILNRMYQPVAFAWRRVAAASAALRQFSPERLGSAARELAREPGPFYVPVLYVEDIVGDPPKVGLSILPNSRCGGVRVSDRPAPVEGLVVVAEERRPETLAHEIGHYLGLCHTHEELAPLALSSEEAGASCDRSGDGMCDTPFDPGVERCAERVDCSLECVPADVQPDPSNVMSYYMGCRRGLSAEQLREARRNLGLRRGWFQCVSPDACPCKVGEEQGCPPEMSCRPDAGDEAGGHCTLDGPGLPGAECHDVADCSRGAICLRAGNGEARCARTCRSSEACACRDVGLPYRVCGEDLEPAR